MMGWNAKMIGRAALPARSYCPRHKRLLVGWNGEGENVVKSTFWKIYVSVIVSTRAVGSMRQFISAG
jgi:hypothetical protein